MRNLVGKLVVAGAFSASVLVIGGASGASAACDPGLGSVLCPPPPTPVPPAPPAPAPEPPAAPAPAPAPSPAPQPDPAPAVEPRSVSDAKARLMALINDDRAEAGLTALAIREDLDELAAAHSTEMAAARRIFHNDEFFTEATKKRIGAKAVGENVASNVSIDDAHRRLMASPGHRANLMSPSFTRLGLGLVDADGTWYLTEVFVTPVASASVPPVVAGAAAATVAPDDRATTRSTTPRAARGDRRATAPTISTASAVAAPADIALDIDFATVAQGSSPTLAPASPSKAPLPLPLPLPLALLALALVLATAVRVTRTTFRNRPTRPMAAAWHPFFWSTIIPMSGN